MLVYFIYRIVYNTCEYPLPFTVLSVIFTPHRNLYIDFCVILFIECITPIQSSFLVFLPLMLSFCFPFSALLSLCPLVNHTSNSHPNLHPCFWPFLPTANVCSHSFLLNVSLSTQYCRQFQKESKHALEPLCYLVSDNRKVGITFHSSQSCTKFNKTQVFIGVRAAVIASMIPIPNYLTLVPFLFVNHKTTSKLYSTFTILWK